MFFKSWNQAYLLKKQNISSPLFVEDNSGFMSAGVASDLLLPREESHQDSPRPSVHSFLQIRFGLGSSVQLLCFCACVCVYVSIAHNGSSSQLLPVYPKCFVDAYCVSNECADWVKSIYGLWDGIGTVVSKGPCAVWLRWPLLWLLCSLMAWFSEDTMLGLWHLAPPTLFSKGK